MINVLQVGMTRNHGGLETYLLQQWRHLNSSEIHYDFVNITGEYPIVAENEIRQSGSEIYSICSRHISPIKHYYQWFKLLKTYGYKYHAIVLNTNTLEYIFPLFLAKFFRIPIRVIHSHNAGFGHAIGVKRKLLISLNRIMMKWSATDYFACSIKAGQWMFGHNQKFSVIKNAIDIKKIKYNPQKRRELRLKWGLESDFVIGHIGAFNYQKNHEFLLDIFEKIHQKNFSAILLLIGGAVDDDSFLKRAQEKVKIRHLEDVVHFLGVRNDVPDLLQIMDCFVLPSHFEGLPLVGIEAQAAGLPCFFSDTITQELGITKLAHFISLNESPAKWAEIILNNRKTERKDMQPEIAAEGYDVKYEIHKLEKIYQGDK